MTWPSRFQPTIPPGKLLADEIALLGYRRDVLPHVPFIRCSDEQRSGRAEARPSGIVVAGHANRSAGRFGADCSRGR